MLILTCTSFPSYTHIYIYTYRSISTYTLPDCPLCFPCHTFPASLMGSSLFWPSACYGLLPTTQLFAPGSPAGLLGIGLLTAPRFPLPVYPYLIGVAESQSALTTWCRNYGKNLLRTGKMHLNTSWSRNNSESCWNFWYELPNCWHHSRKNITEERQSLVDCKKI